MSRSLMIVLALSCLTACATGSPPASDAGPESDPPDASPTCQELQMSYPDRGFFICGTECVSILEDPAHCGGCDESCDFEHADSCNDGFCGCGDGFPCQEPARCAYRQNGSICVVPDYAGKQCDLIDVGCPQGQVCAGGHCTVPIPTPEVCDGYDNDFDGQVDEDPQGPLIWERDCYSGPPGTENVGECLGGTQQCRLGSWTPCFGETLPIPETGLFQCDMRDNDCNGCVDDHWEDGELVCDGETDGHQITFIVDISGSMSDDIAAVVTASATFGAPYAAAPYIEWGIMRTGLSGMPYYDAHLAMTSFALFNVSLGSLSTAAGGGTEPSWQATYDLATGVFDSPMGIDPDPNQIYIVFTDEDAATGGNNTTGLTQTQVCDAVAARGATLAVFTNAMSMPSWSDCAIVYELSNDPVDMALKMDDLLDNVCGY